MEEYYTAEDVHEGPGKMGITERGTLYREDTSPSPPPDRRPVYSPPQGYREDSRSTIPTIPTVLVSSIFSSRKVLSMVPN